MDEEDSEEFFNIVEGLYGQKFDKNDKVKLEKMSESKENFNNSNLNLEMSIEKPKNDSKMEIERY